MQVARSLVLDRDILLLDEPLAALDAQLRKDMCYELKHLQEKEGITFIHVTHNQQEPMTVADRIALIAEGNLIECADARAMYESPNNVFTANFVGDNNLLSGSVTAVNQNQVSVAVAEHTITVDQRDLNVQPGDNVSVSIRSESTHMNPLGAATLNTNGINELPATYRESTYLGLTTSSVLSLPNGQEIISRVISADAGQSPAPGAPILISWAQGAARLHIHT